MNSNSSLKHLMYYSWLIWGIAAAFAIFQQYTVSVFGLFSSQFSTMLSVSKIDISFMSASFFIAFSLMQIPAGLLLDRYSIKVIYRSSIIISLIGLLVFYFIPYYIPTLISVYIMGLGMSISFVGGIMLIIRWFPSNRFALMVGLLGGAQYFGVALISILSVYIVNHYNIYYLLALLITVNIILLIFIFIFIKPTQADSLRNYSSKKVYPNIFTSLKGAILIKDSWYVGIYNSCLLGTAIAFSTFWNFSYQKQFDNTATNITIINSMILIGLALGNPFAGWLSDKIKSRIKPARLFAVLSLLCLLIILSGIIPTSIIYIIMFLYGFFSNTSAISFAYAKEHTSFQYHGTVCGLLNTICFIVVTLLQIIPGIFYEKLNFIYSDIYHYSAAFLIFPSLIVIGIIATFFMNETNCQPVK
ncbi:MAG TPA: MFS transporter [Victivallales bacterium]|nr:MFS transporter [Victivallales bacterium]